MNKKSTTPTMKDVAEEAGVALGTVSKVFNGIPVGDRYKAKVMEAAGKLGYQVNNYARGMRTNKTQTVAIIMPIIDHPYFAKLTEMICRELSERNYKSFIAVTDREPNAEAKCINMVCQNKADGIIALTYNPNFNDIGNVPFISIDRSFDGAVSCVSSDNFSGGQMAAAKLIELGCRKLLFVRTGTNVPGETDKRGAGFENYCQSRQIIYESLISADEPDHIRLFEKLHKMCQEKRFDFDGIFCSTDLLAYQVMQIVKSYGFRIPEDVQVIGFDGLRDFFSGEYICSTIVQPVEQIAKVAVQKLLEMTKETSPSLTCLPVSYRKGPTTRD